MSEDKKIDPEVEAGNYEIIRARLVEQAKALGAKAEGLNQRRKQSFGGTELTVLANERVRTENNCTPRDIVGVGKKLLFGYNVHLGLRTETKIGDVLSLHHFEEGESWDLSAVGGESFLSDPRFAKDFQELYKYYKDATLLQLRRTEARLLAIFRVGSSINDIKAFRFTIDVNGGVTYLDNRGERDFHWPHSHDFEWTSTSRDQHVKGRHPHINIEDAVFVETVGGDLTIKVEDNTDDGQGIYREPVEDRHQALDDAEVAYARLGTLIVLKILPYRETSHRYLVFNTRNQHVRRIDAIGTSCLQLPEDHGIVFPGGYYLRTGEQKVFTEDTAGLRVLEVVRSPNGEDVLYVFHRQSEGESLLLPYNLIRKEVQNPISCHGYSIFPNGRMLVFKNPGTEASRVHPMQIWQTPFVSHEFAASAPTDGSFLAKIGNAELVRGISDALSIARLIENQEPTRVIYEDLVRATNRAIDTYYWLSDRAEVGDLASTLKEIATTAELIIDEFEKVQQLRQKAKKALAEATAEHQALVRKIHPEDFREVQEFLGAMAELRAHRGHLITLREVRYIELPALDALEGDTAEQFKLVSRAAVEYLLRDDALLPIKGGLDRLLGEIEAAARVMDIKPLEAELEKTNAGLTVLSEVIGDLEVEDPAARTRIVESISEVFGHLNRVRATLANQKRDLLRKEGRSDFAAQFTLFGQSVSNAIAVADTPEACDEQLSRILVQLEELESRFSEFDEFVGELATKREEVYDGFAAKKQTLMDERNRRAQNLMGAAGRILAGLSRRAQSFKKADDLNAFFASDAMVLKLRQLAEQLDGIGDTVKAEEIRSKIKQAKQDALRGLRDRTELYEEGESVVRFGRHRFSVTTQPLELTIVPREEGLAFHLTGTDYAQLIEDEALRGSRDLWDQTLLSETDEVYRGEYLAASIFFDAEARRGLDLDELHHAWREEGGLVKLVRKVAADRYDEGYERGLHDGDAARILDKLLSLFDGAGLLRFAPTARAYAVWWWARLGDQKLKASLHRRAQSLGRLRASFLSSPAERAFAAELSGHVARFLASAELEPLEADLRNAGRYLLEELTREQPRFVVSANAAAIKDAFLGYLTLEGRRAELEADLSALAEDPRAQYALARAWFEAFLGSDEAHSLHPGAMHEAVVLTLTERTVDREISSASTAIVVDGLLGQHGRIKDRSITLELDELLTRLGDFAERRVPRFREYRKLRHALIETERHRLRLDEFKPRVLSTFVRNKLINEVYLPLIGDNLAKQLGALGEGKRTDLMGMLLLISPPGYGKTTLMEYLANSLGMVFMKVNGPSLGHSVTSLDPAEAPNATARQEVEKINLALEMGNNVMLYLDDIQHTNPELLQKFISLCDAQRRIEGVWRGRTRTYDLRGKKFCVVMAGNPYTESGEKFTIPDMLANRADTYNLGDVLEGKDLQFALSYIENALTSNSVLAPLATRDQQDIYKLIRRARGEEVASTDLSYGYSASELAEIDAVLKKLFVCQEVLLKVNLEYIRSASQADEYRTEPPFKLQGSYRNMTKLAEKVVSAMNERELTALIDDHYQGEAQTLTTGAEQNLLKLAELRGRLSEVQAARWTQIKKDFGRIKLAGGREDDPVARVTGTLGGLGQQLDGIRESLLAATAEAAARDQTAKLLPQLAQLEAALARLAEPKLSVQVKSEAPKGLDALLAHQAKAIEQTLVPMVLNSTRTMEEAQAIGRPLAELLELLKLRLFDKS